MLQAGRLQGGGGGGGGLKNTFGVKKQITLIRKRVCSNVNYVARNGRSGWSGATPVAV